MFAMRVDKGPFADNRIREAFKLLVNRQDMIDGAWSGFGTVANDLLCPGTEYYASDLKQTQDVDKAKSLFKAAGVLGDTFVLPTSNFLPGMVESATILAQQALAAGVKVSVHVESASTYWTTAGGFGTRPFGQEVNQPAASLLTYYLAEYTKSAPYPDTHWGYQTGGAASERLIDEAIAATNPARAKSSGTSANCSSLIRAAISFGAMHPMWTRRQTTYAACPLGQASATTTGGCATGGFPDV